MPTSARRIAWEILRRVETQSSYATELLYSPLTARLSSQDAALCTELVLGTLRWQATLDFLWQQFTRKKGASLDPEVRVALRLGLYQLRFLTRMPARAALHETVELVKTGGKRSAAGLVNAVLHQGGPADLASLRPPSLPEPEWWGITLSHPSWLLERWARQYGREEALSLAEANNQPAPIFLRFNSRNRNPAEMEEPLRKQDILVRPGNFLKDCRAVVKGNAVRAEPYRRGEIMVQDEASQIVPYLLDVQEGHRVLDLCAAPGHKTALLAQWAGIAGQVIACDLHWHRLKEMIPLPPQSRVYRVALDGREPLPFRIRFDRILVDAPCSGTGTLRRHPEIKWRLTPGDITDLSEKQFRLLDSAAAALRPGGRIVYSTCSLEKEENQGVVERFLQEHPEFHLLPLREEARRLQPFFHPASAWILENDFLVTSPARDGTDGFFAAILGQRPIRTATESEPGA